MKSIRQPIRNYCLTIYCTVYVRKGSSTQRLHVCAVHVMVGCWGCYCFPIFGALYQKNMTGPDELQHNGVCFVGPVPLCPFKETWKRHGNTNKFSKGDGNFEIYTDRQKGTATCQGLSCARQLCHFPNDPVKTSDAQGCWTCYGTSSLHTPCIQITHVTHLRTAAYKLLTPDSALS